MLRVTHASGCTEKAAPPAGMTASWAPGEIILTVVTKCEPFGLGAWCAISRAALEAIGRARCTEPSGFLERFAGARPQDFLSRAGACTIAAVLDITLVAPQSSK